MSEEIARLQRLTEVAERAIEVQKTGVSLTPQERFEVFGEITFDLGYATEAELKWAGSKGQREAMARATAHTKEDWRRLMSEAAAWRADLLAAFDEREPSDGERAMDLAEEHRLHISRWFTSCPPDMHRRIADDFVADLGQGFADAMGESTDLLLLSTTTAPLGWHLTEAWQTYSRAAAGAAQHLATADGAGRALKVIQRLTEG